MWGGLQVGQPLPSPNPNPNPNPYSSPIGTPMHTLTVSHPTSLLSLSNLPLSTPPPPSPMVDSYRKNQQDKKKKKQLLADEEDTANSMHRMVTSDSAHGDPEDPDYGFYDQELAQEYLTQGRAKLPVSIAVNDPLHSTGRQGGMDDLEMFVQTRKVYPQVTNEYHHYHHHHHTHPPTHLLTHSLTHISTQPHTPTLAPTHPYTSPSHPPSHPLTPHTHSPIHTLSPSERLGTSRTSRRASLPHSLRRYRHTPSQHTLSIPSNPLSTHPLNPLSTPPPTPPPIDHQS